MRRKRPREEGASEGAADDALECGSPRVEELGFTEVVLDDEVPALPPRRLRMLLLLPNNLRRLKAELEPGAEDGSGSLEAEERCEMTGSFLDEVKREGRKGDKGGRDVATGPRSSF